ncbi:gliding motility lipoprotein GldJ [Bacteroidia bacterium]|nr:gliding motility lipoprotein GldJ [Bacteroidia bacterium]
MKRHNILDLSVCCLLVIGMNSCSMLGIGGSRQVGRSNTTGWAYNDPKTGGMEYKGYGVAQKTGPGLVFIPGGSFVMGRNQDDVMGDWNNSPRHVTIASFYIDEHEVRNVDWLEYLYWLGRTYVSYPEVYKRAVPDTLVWRSQLAYNEPMVKNYLRYPSYGEYPVVGVSWEQASEYCVWRTDRVNEQILIQANVLFADIENQKDENVFTTESYLSGQYVGSVNKNYKGLGKEPRAVRWEDGLLLSDYRLATEAEWEFAAYGTITTNERVASGQLYPWEGTYLRNVKKEFRGRMMANFVRSKGDYMGVGGREANDGFEFTAPVKSFWPNDYGLYDMAGNVNEWVADVYRPLSSHDISELNPFRGNVFQTTLLDADGNAAPKDSLGRMRKRNQTDAELATRENYRVSDNRNFNDGDVKSRITAEGDWKGEEKAGSADMYYRTTTGEGEITSLIDDEARVYKGGSWRDRPYWLNPGTRRFLSQKKSTNDIGFRCAMSHSGGLTTASK